MLFKLWFENCRVRDRKEEVSGCICPCTKYHRMRLGIFKQKQEVVSTMSTNVYPGYYLLHASHYPGGTVTPPQSVHVPIYLPDSAILSDISSPAHYVVVGVQGSGCAYRSLISDSLLVPVSNGN